MITVLMLLGMSVSASAQPITTATIWSGQRSIDEPVVVQPGVTLTIEPGSQITFGSAGRLTLNRGATLQAVGSADKPIVFEGNKAGEIIGYTVTVQAEFCQFRNFATGNDKQRYAMQLIAGAGGVSFKQCTLADSKGISTSGDGPVSVIGCDFRNSTGNVELSTTNVVTFTDNTAQNTSFMFLRIGGITLRNNVLIDGMFWGPRNPLPAPDKVLIEGNYIRNHKVVNTYGILSFTGTLRDNVIRGGTWCVHGCGGTITGNVIEAFSAEEIKRLHAAGTKDFTHEHIVALPENVVITRNIFINASYGAVMGTEPHVGRNALVQNNTFDLRSNNRPIFLNHLAKGDGPRMTVRNNLFMRCSEIYDEKNIPDSLAYVDYNLWASPLAKEAARFANLTITGKNPGDEGFGSKDIPAYADRAKIIPIQAVVVNPDFSLNVSDQDMLARQVSIADVLKQYREAYRLTENSPAIDAGHPQSADDLVRDGKPDLGAIER